MSAEVYLHPEIFETSEVMPIEQFSSRHIGPGAKAQQAMLDQIGFSSVDELIEKTVPADIRLKAPLAIADGMTEFEYLAELKTKAAKNKLFKTYIGMGYHPVVLPPVIQRNILENPGWYTAYTPYQAEIAQGRLEALLNFQTMTSDLTGLPISNASLLDEGTAAAEAMGMFFNNRSKEQKADNAVRFFIDENCFPQTIDVIKTRAIPMGILPVVGSYKDYIADNTFFGALLQYPDGNGEVKDYSAFVASNKANGIKTAVATDLMALAILTPPGEWGADVVFGNSQRFGVPMGFGGPHAAFFCTTDEFKRVIPGRIIGVSVDRSGKQALRMALQTREQHIRRDKATSNICTAQALLAVMASSYAVYHGAVGIRRRAVKMHNQASALGRAISQLGYRVSNQVFFETLKINVGSDLEVIIHRAENAQINLRNFEDGMHVGITVNETTNQHDLVDLVSVFTGEKPFPQIRQAGAEIVEDLPEAFLRKSEYLQHPVFSSYHSESEMMRYLKRLENKDFSLTHSMIALGSCTMKLNSASELMPITWPEFAHLHPFAPKHQTQGYKEILRELETSLCEITGFAGVSLQPNSGAQGEYAGLMVIRAYHESRGDFHRNICLIPSSAHGTNPASAVMAGMKVVVVACDTEGNIDFNDLKEKAALHANDLSCMMVTYPSTHGVYEEGIKEMTATVHQFGGQVYMDGANMNAQVGLTNPGNIGADVCHLNLHKTFAIPHGGGGPGMGPIGVAKHLVPFLPGNPVIKTGGDQAITAISSAPWGSALILLISYGYIKMLGSVGVTDATKIAILNANYMKTRLENHFPVLYTGKSGTVAHEMILDCRAFKQSAGIEVEDIAKRLMDYGFHAPTVSFPVAGTLMIEPTESESKEELDRFCDALIQIRHEIGEVEADPALKGINRVSMAPHTMEQVCANEWDRSYSREAAAYPLAFVRSGKIWPSVARIDNAFGDRNLVCTCPPIEEYA